MFDILIEWIAVGVICVILIFVLCSTTYLAYKIVPCRISYTITGKYLYKIFFKPRQPLHNCSRRCKLSLLLLTFLCILLESCNLFRTLLLSRYGTVGGGGTSGTGSGGPGSTMTLGRRGHYASLRAARAADNDLPILGPNQGQYATLSKGCKTLESSDFY